MQAPRRRSAPLVTWTRPSQSSQSSRVERDRVPVGHRALPPWSPGGCAPAASCARAATTTAPSDGRPRPLRRRREVARPEARSRSCRGRGFRAGRGTTATPPTTASREQDPARPLRPSPGRRPFGRGRSEQALPHRRRRRASRPRAASPSRRRRGRGRRPRHPRRPVRAAAVAPGLLRPSGTSERDDEQREADRAELGERLEVQVVHVQDLPLLGCSVRPPLCVRACSAPERPVARHSSRATCHWRSRPLLESENKRLLRSCRPVRPPFERTVHAVHDPHGPP